MRAAEPAHRLEHDRDRTGEQQHAVGLRGEHLGPLEAVGVALGGRALRERERAEREAEREHVGGEVRGVGEQREAAEQEPAHELDHEKRRVRDERDEQRPAASSKGGVDAANLPARLGATLPHPRL